MIISICICTYNRSEILAYCLHSLSQLIDPRPKNNIEVIVVDNNSSDQTPELVRGIIRSFPFEMRYVFEAQQGLAAARNRGVAEATGDYVAFLDDECIVNSDWLSIIISDIKEYHPCVIGGPYVGAFLPGDRPRWFKIEYGNAYFLKHHLVKGFHTEFRASGGNMIVRRDVFETARFDVNLGMKGGKLKIGEEIDLQERFLRTHPLEAIFFEPAITVQHFILPEKMRLSYRARRVFGAALADPNKVSRKDFLRSFIKTIGSVILAPFGCVCRDRAVHPFWQNYVYEQAVVRTCGHAGRVAKYLRGSLRKKRTAESRED